MCLDLAARRRTGSPAAVPPRSPRSRATLFSARWMSTLTAPPSDRAGRRSPRWRARRRSAGPSPGGARRGVDPRLATPPRLVAPDRRRLDVERIDDRTAAGSRRAGLGRRRRRARRSATAFRAIWNSQTRKVEAPSPSGGTGPLLEPVEVGQRRDERRLGRVLREVVVAQLVEGVGVHACEIPAVQGIEPGRVTLRGLDQRPVSVEMGEPGTGDLLRSFPISTMLVAPSCYTPAAVVALAAAPPLSSAPAAVPAFAIRAWRISPTRHGPHGTRRAVIDEECPRGAVDADRQRVSRPCRRALSSSIRRPVETWRAGPLVDVEAILAQRLERGSRAGSRRRPATRRDRSADHRMPRAATSSRSRDRPGKSAAAQSVSIPSPTTTRGSIVPRPSVSPRTPRACGSPWAPSPPAGPTRRSSRRRGRSATSGGPVPSGTSATASAAPAIAREAAAASCQTRSCREPVGTEAERQQQCGIRPAPPTMRPAPAATGRLLVRDREADFRRPGRGASRARRRWSSRRRPNVPGGRGSRP